MRNLSPAVRQKLAILLKSKEAANGGVLPPGNNPVTSSPNLAPPPPQNGMTLPKPIQANQPLFGTAEKELSPRFFNIRKKLKPI